jgi:hypothetical protein
MLNKDMQYKSATPMKFNSSTNACIKKKYATKLDFKKI